MIYFASYSMAKYEDCIFLHEDGKTAGRSIKVLEQLSRYVVVQTWLMATAE